MELNAKKITSLEDEVKLLKGEVKLILSEIRAAILGQNNPFSSDAGQSLYADPEALAERPPIRVVKVALEKEDEEEEVALAPSPPEPVSEIPWVEEELPAVEEPELEADEAETEAATSIDQGFAPPSAAQRPAPTSQEDITLSRFPAAEPAFASRQETTPVASPQATPSWSLIKVAGLMVWAEEALKQVGPDRLQIMLDLCEFAGYLPTTAKEALTRVMSLGLAVDVRKRPPSTNECLVILYQLHALMQDEETSSLARGRARASR